MAVQTSLNGIERFFERDEIIVSKTDLKGIITYANVVFQRVARYTEDELLGQPHNIIRHPDMPRCVFKFLWDTIEAGNEIFAYIVNRTKHGDHYWVFAHVTPTFDTMGNIIGYHSNRRVPERSALDVVKPIYAALLAEEKRHRTPREQWQALMPMLLDKLEDVGMAYDEFMFSICGAAS
jgi:PAS domain S-box-containing protein